MQEAHDRFAVPAANLLMIVAVRIVPLLVAAVVIANMICVVHRL